ncbi:MAG: flagellar hook-associated protein FlgL [Actinobacteria bacterium]|nr:flagellar hook-associated protein FlgL [Actinomycetota bacterium]
MNATGVGQLTQSSLALEMASNLNSEEVRIGSLEEQISTGFSINQPSDNPAQTVNILSLQSQSARLSQYGSNASNAKAWLGTANTTLNQVLSVLQQVEQAALSASSAQTEGPSALDALATQIAGMRSELLNLSNTTYDSQYIFAGTAEVAQAYDANGSYLGGGPPPTRTVSPGVTVAVGVSGPSVFGSGTSGLLSDAPGDLGVLSQIVSDLQSGNISAVEGADLHNLHQAVQTVESAAALIGATYQSVQVMQSQVTQNQQALSGELSSALDLNLPKATTQLQALQDSYQAALWATSQIEQSSLVQYLS